MNDILQIKSISEMHQLRVVIDFALVVQWIEQKFPKL